MFKLLRVRREELTNREGWEAESLRVIRCSLMIPAKIELEERRGLGRFDTPRSLAVALARWGIRAKTERILEPSCGGGVFVLGIEERLAELGAANGSSQIWACDVDERALVETAFKCSLPRENLLHGNFLTSTAKDFTGGEFDSILGNPPYVRLHMMAAEDRKVARLSLDASAGIGAKASLWAYFPPHAFKFLRPGGRMGWILPETLLHSTYGRELLSWADSRFAKCTVVSVRERCFESEGAKERVVILLLEGSNQPASNGVNLVEFTLLSEAVDYLCQAPPMQSLPQLNGHAVPKLLGETSSNFIDRLNMNCFRALGELAEIKIGVVSGDNSFFIFSEDQRRARSIRRRHFQPLVAKFSQLPAGWDFTGFPNDHTRTDKILVPVSGSKDQSLHRFLKSYPKKRKEANQTMKKRPLWHTPILGEVPDAFFCYMGSVAPRVVLNSANYYCTNNIHRLYFKNNVSSVLVKGIVLALSSTYSQLSAEIEGRQYGSGVLKLEPSEAKKIVVPWSLSLLSSLALRWDEMVSLSSTGNLNLALSEIDACVASSLPELEAAFPLSEAKKILRSARIRRTGKDCVYVF